MNEDILKALMRLFAIVADVNREGAYGNERDIITEYLQRQFSSEHVNSFISYFDQYLLRYHPKFMYENDREAQKQNDYNSAKIVDICNQINEELEQKQKIIVIVYLLDFINRGEKLTENEINFVNLVGKSLKIDPVEFHDLRAFTFGTIVQIKSKTELLYIDANEDSGHPEIKHMKNDRLDGRIRVIRISSANMLVFRYEGRSELFLNGHNIKTNRSYIWSVGSVIKSSRVGSIYYTHVAGKFIQSLVQTKFTFTAKDIEFRFKNSENGVRRFNFSEESGRLIGIIGGSGSGKSTLLNVLNGNLKLRNGSISINNLDLHENKDMLKGLIGYVPQEDLLFKELTVFENLYFNARLCFSDYSKEKITEVVETALMDFDLVEARDLRVGDEVKTILSGGQRKRLNIALELMREPAILFVDEPTSGLSSMDSEKVMSLLKRQTFRGRLVITNIHQPSSDLYKLLDKLLVMDQGGRVIYYGNPIDAISYFKDISHFAAASEAECKACGNINSDQILRIVEARVVDVNGRLTRKRKTSPQEWYDKYTETIDPIIKQIKRTFTAKLPKNNFSIPSRWKQLKLFFSRDLLAKLSNKQYLI
ncbi:MAG: ATP-binding cassette domain-containing protein, partial [Bacteroidota bacterium]